MQAKNAFAAHKIDYWVPKLEADGFMIFLLHVRFRFFFFFVSSSFWME